MHTHILAPAAPPPGLESAQIAVLKASAPRAESSPCLHLLGSLHTLCFPSLSREVGWSLHLPCAEGERILCKVCAAVSAASCGSLQGWGVGSMMLTSIL